MIMFRVIISFDWAIHDVDNINIAHCIASQDAAVI